MYVIRHPAAPLYLHHRDPAGGGYCSRLEDALTFDTPHAAQKFAADIPGATVSSVRSLLRKPCDLPESNPAVTTPAVAPAPPPA